MTDQITQPLSVNVDGRTWNLFSADYTNADGRYSFYFYAISFEHAAAVLAEIKETATLAGQVGGIVTT